jgi:hypothetical protein
MKRNVDVLSQVTGDPPGSLPASFTGVGQNVTMVKITTGQTAKSRRSFQTSGQIRKIIKKHPLCILPARSQPPELVCGGPKVKGIVSRDCHLSKSAATWTSYRWEKWKSKVDKMSQPWIHQNYSRSEWHSVTKRPLFGVDGQSFHFETECHSRKLSQSQNVTVEKCHMVEVSQ